MADMHVYRCYVEKKAGFDVEAERVLREIRDQLGIEGVTGLRLFNRYDVQGLEESVYRRAKGTVFAEPQVDEIFDEELPEIEGQHSLVAVEALPGQYDQRADCCAQCVMLLSGAEKPSVRNARVYVLFGTLTRGELVKIKDYLINPVESREASMDKPDTLEESHPAPAKVAVLEGLTGLDDEGLREVLSEYGLAMNLADLKLLQEYFRDKEKRDPTVTELRVVDTYWSDHCRHTTFGTQIDAVEILDEDAARAYRRYLDTRAEVYGAEQAAVRPQTLMDIGTIAAKALKKRGVLKGLDESEEINACSVHVSATVDGEEQDWLLMFKNETHNHPTEIEPFGGAATCIGGCIRDPLSGRAYVYQAMRVTGCGDPRTPLDQTLPGKLPQRKLCQTAAAGYSSYGNQIGLATGLVSELYHPGYVAKHLEIGAVVGAAPADHVVRENPAPGDVVILLGGRTGRDGIGGATGSSKSHNRKSLQTMASEVQKGNAPEERKLQRLFRDPRVTRLIRRCNDFGAGGVSVAIGELADGVTIDLDAVRKKYDGLDGTELAISESQERMAVVVAPGDAEEFLEYAARENLEACVVAQVTQAPRMVMTWNGDVVVDLSREFLSSNGAVRHTTVTVPKPEKKPEEQHCVTFHQRCDSMLRDPNLASQRGLTERFDSTVGGGSVLVPFGGKTQTSPTQVMAALLPVGPGHETEDCSVMSYGFDPRLTEENPFKGAACAVVDSVCKLVAAGCAPEDAYLTFQEYFEKLREDPARWGKPFAALLGALDAQLSLGVAAIGGKDSMSGSFLDLDVPPTLVSFAIAHAKASQVLSPEFKAPGHRVCLFQAPEGDYEETRRVWNRFHELCQAGKVRSAWAVGAGGVMEGVVKMSFGNEVGFVEQPGLELDWFKPRYGSIIAELEGDCPDGLLLGRTSSTVEIAVGGATQSIASLRDKWEDAMEKVYPTRAKASGTLSDVAWEGRSPLVAAEKFARPRAVIPVFPGTNCEYDTANACLKAGIEPEILVVRSLNPDVLNQSAQALADAIGRSQMLILPGGFSGGDEPDGSAKLIVSFFRGARLADAVTELLKHRDGLILGICNGFQALVKLGLVPYGEIRAADPSSPTLTFNLIGRHQSRYVTTKITSLNSPWMLKSQLGDLHTIPVSHGEGRFTAPEPVLARMIAGGQIATRYVTSAGVPSLSISANPNGSVEAVEGIFSPDGRVFGKMGHSEREGKWIAKNIPGEKYQPIFESGALYYK